MVGAIGQPDAHLGEVPCAYVELMQGANVHSEELLKFVQQKLDNKLAMPTYIEVLTELPKTPVGKIFKPDLRKMAISRIFSSELQDNKIEVSEIDVVEDKVLGLLAVIAAPSAIDDETIGASLNKFTIPWKRL